MSNAKERVIPSSAEDGTFGEITNLLIAIGKSDSGTWFDTLNAAFKMIRPDCLPWLHASHTCANFLHDKCQQWKVAADGLVGSYLRWHEQAEVPVS